MEAYNLSYHEKQDIWWYGDDEMYLSRIHNIEVEIGDVVYIMDGSVFSKKKIINIQWDQDYISQQWLATMDFEALDDQYTIPNHLESNDLGLRDANNEMYTMHVPSYDMETNYGFFRQPDLLKSVFRTTPNNVIMKDFIIENNVPNYVRDITYTNGNYLFTYNTQLESEYEPNDIVQVLRFEGITMMGG